MNASSRALSSPVYPSLQPAGSATSVTSTRSSERARRERSSAARYSKDRVSSVLPLGDEPDDAERGQCELGGVRLVVPRDLLRFDGAEVADAGAAVVVGVRVQRLAPLAAQRHPDAVAVARDGREIADADELPAAVG